MLTVGQEEDTTSMFNSITQSLIGEQLATELPYALVCVLGIAIALIFWQRAPSSSLYVLLACALTLFLLILHPFAWQIARRVFQGTALTARGVNIMFAVFWSVERGLFAGLMLF